MRLFLLVVLFQFALNANKAHAQCAYEFDYKVEVANEKSTSNLILKLNKGESTNNYRCVLYDLRSSKVVEETTASMIRNVEKVVFKNLRPSIYTVYIFYPGCSEPISIGGVSGIKTIGL